MPIKTITGNPIIIYDSSNSNPTDLSITLNYSQSGSGEPSETNIRNFAYLSVGEILVEGVNSSRTLAVSLGENLRDGIVDVRLGTITKHYYYKQLTGGETWSGGEIGTNRQRYYMSFVNNSLPSGIQGATVFSNYFKTTSSWTGEAFGSITVASSGSYLFIPDTLTSHRFSSLNEFKSWLTNCYTSGKPVEILYELATDIVTSISPETIELYDGYNRITTNFSSISLSYNAKKFSVIVPANFNATPANPYEGETVKLTYSGDMELRTVNVIGVETMHAVTVAQTSSNTWTFKMPSEDVGVTFDFKDYANIELIQSAGGIITADKTIAYDGDVVTLTFTPNENYQFLSAKVSKNARDVEISKVSDNQYQFTVHII